jgi:hypothetical protein
VLHIVVWDARSYCCLQIHLSVVHEERGEEVELQKNGQYSSSVEHTAVGLRCSRQNKEESVAKTGSVIEEHSCRKPIVHSSMVQLYSSCVVMAICPCCNNIVQMIK